MLKVSALPVPLSDRVAADTDAPAVSADVSNRKKPRLNRVHKLVAALPMIWTGSSGSQLSTAVSTLVSASMNAQVFPVATQLV